MAFSLASVVLCVVVFVAPWTRAQSGDMCTTKSSNFSGMIDVVCKCKQSLKQWSSPIYELTIDQEGCENSGVEISWSKLETVVKPQVVTITGSEVYFYEDPSEDEWPPSIRELKIIGSELKALPKNALRGLGLLEEFTIFNSEVLKIEKHAVADLANLRIVEIANSTIGEVKPNAFNNLPAVVDLAFLFSEIGSIEPNAITNVGPSHTSAMMDCTSFGDDYDASGRSMDFGMGILDEIMGRQLNTAPDLALPKYGSRLLLYKNNIGHLKTSAVRDSGFGFLILGGNNISDFYSEALDTEIHNECEISAVLIIENRIDRVHSFAIAKIRGREGSSEATFIAMSNNTFLEVETRGFHLASSLVIFNVAENRFSCTCEDFDWVLKDMESPEQRNLEKDLITKGKCEDGLSVISFTTTCTDGGNPTTTPEAPLSTRRPFTPRPPFTTPSVPDGSSMTSSNPFVHVTVFLVLVVTKWLM
ncbi:uncharacterized protein LOC143035952 [Oratosquilla oratoria]|uniref:uncharacterized protein LOC143035952 n=1 Tax=Oratosquilla oratoria TaxID=337810 RepID=UPI003F76F6E4